MHCRERGARLEADLARVRADLAALQTESKVPFNLNAFKSDISLSKKYSNAPCHCPRSTQTHHVTVLEAFKRTMSLSKEHSNATYHHPRSIQAHHVTVQEVLKRTMSLSKKRSYAACHAPLARAAQCLQICRLVHPESCLLF